MTTTELVKKVLSVDVHEAERIYSNELEVLGLQLYNKRAKGCGNCLIEIYIKLYKNGIEMAEAKEKQTQRVAELKDNVILRVPQMGITWSNVSNDFTDEKAKEVLKKYPALKSRFKKLPLEDKPKGRPKKEEETSKKAE